MEVRYWWKHGNVEYQENKNRSVDNLVPRVLRLFGQRLVVPLIKKPKDSGYEIDQSNEKRSLIPWGLRVPISKMNFCSKRLRLSVLP